MKYVQIVILISSFCFTANTQSYELSWKKDLLAISIGTGVTTLGSIIQKKADKAILSDINRLRVEDLNFIDRGATTYYSSTAQDISDVVLYSSLAFPIITFASTKCRKNTGAILLMTTEVALLTKGVTDIMKGSFKRYRPFNYNPNIEESIKLGESSRRSFISGHTSNVAALTFLTAKIVTDLHPEIKHKGLIWGTAIILPAVVGGLRVKAGKHFPTDVIAGYAVGAAIGFFIPAIHLKDGSKVNLTALGVSDLAISVNF